jgi:cell division protein FtsB
VTDRDGYYDRFEQDVMEATKDAMRRHTMRPVLVGLVLAILVGCVGTFYSIANAQHSAAASREDVRQNAALLAQLEATQDKNAREAKAFREDSRRLTLAICDQIEAIARQARLDVPPCPRVGK